MLYHFYRIWVETADGKILSYYGRSKKIENRKKRHISRHKAWVEAGRPRVSDVTSNTSSVFVLDHEGWIMDIVETQECTKEESYKIEGKWIRENDCVNMRIAGRTKAEWTEENKEHVAEYKHEWYEKNKDRILEEQKERYKENKEEIDAKNKIRYEKNRDNILIQNKKRYEENKDEILKKQKEYHQKNKEIINERNRNYSKQPHVVQRVKDYGKVYRELNKEKIAIKEKEKCECELCGSIVTKKRLVRHQKSKKCAKLSQPITDVTTIEKKVPCDICGSHISNSKAKMTRHQNSKKCAKLSQQNTNADALPSSA